MGKRTPLYEEHIKLGANIVPFAGWDMPVSYTAVIEEHTATRNAAGLFDTSHMGEFEVTGPQSVDFLQSIVTNDVGKMTPGFALYSALPNERGGCVDDIYLYMISAERFYIVVNAANIDKDFAWISARTGGWNVKVANLSDYVGMIALQGPAAKDIMAKLTKAELPARFYFKRAEVAGIDTTVSRTGYTGEDGVELFVKSEHAAAMWRAVLDAGAPLGLKPNGLGARDTLRLEACYSLYGHELSDDISPIEACISFAVAKNKKFIGSDVILGQAENGPVRKVMAFELTQRGVPRDGYKVFAGAEEVGHVTSGCFSPTLQKGIGLAMLKLPFAKVGQEIEVEIRGKKYAGIVAKRPFIKHV
jgi:aminomethyltransferase